ncbi:MAG: HNH endonuclease [Desulfovibrio sp.]|nr:HNH endonuclease [Desulfovibrio sp.]
MKRLWTRDELILTFNLYLKLPFGQLHKGRPEVIRLAKLINRSVNAVALRLVNFAACDPVLKNRGIKGMSGGLKQCQPIWEEFYHDREHLLYESELILARLENINLEKRYEIDIDQLQGKLGMEKDAIIRRRVNQDVFRAIVLANYNYKCAITGIDIDQLLVASHIKPWALDERARLDPQNGLCLSSLYDKAFDSGLISFDEDLRLIYSSKITEKYESKYFKKFFKPYEKAKLTLPLKYNPNQIYISWHRNNIFKK